MSTLDQNIANVDPYAENNSPAWSDAGIALKHGQLNLDGKLNRIHHASEFHKSTVTHVLYGAAAILGLFRFKK